MSDRVLGLIAGEGRLPLMVAEGMKAAGARVCGLGLRGHFDPLLPELCDFFRQVGVFRIGGWIRTLRKHGVKEAVLAGRISKTKMHNTLRLLRAMPDLRTAKVWYRRLRGDRRSSAVLGAVADELLASGVTLIDVTTYIGESVAGKGVLTRVRTTPQQEAEIATGWPVLERLVELEIGQSIAVCSNRVIAVEALEGTDAMIQRAGRLNGGGQWTLLKTPSKHHDMRCDVPTIGPKTIEQMAGAGAGCVALRRGRVIMIDKPQLIRAADRAGIPVVGVG